MVNNVKKITVIGLMVFVAFCMLSCETVGSLASGLISGESGSSGSSNSSSGGGQGRAAPNPNPATITIVNKTGNEIFYLRIKRCSDTSWPIGYLGRNDPSFYAAESLRNGASLTITLREPLVPAHNDYDIKLTTSEGGKDVDYLKKNVLLSNGMTLTFTESDKVVVASTTTVGGGQGRAIPRSNPNQTRSIAIMNRLGSGVEITGLWIMAAGDSNWGNNLLFRPIVSSEIVNLPSAALNDANKFSIRAVTNKGQTVTLSNIVVAPNGTVEIK